LSTPYMQELRKSTVLQVVAALTARSCFDRLKNC
jgi:hypothetical protein